MKFQKNQQREVLIGNIVKDLQELRLRLKTDIPAEYDHFCNIINKYKNGEDYFLYAADNEVINRNQVVEMIIKYVEISGADHPSLKVLKQRLQQLKH